VNREFAREIFGSARKAIGSYYKMPDGTRIQVWVLPKMENMQPHEDPHQRCFSYLQWLPAPVLVVRSSRDPHQLGTAVRATLHQMAAALPSYD